MDFTLIGIEAKYLAYGIAIGTAIGAALMFIAMWLARDKHAPHTRWKRRHPKGMAQPTLYEQKIIDTFKELCEKNGGASPAEVTHLMADRDQLSAVDTVIDIADQMKALRARGML